MYFERINLICELVTKLCAFKYSPLVWKIAPPTTLKWRMYEVCDHLTIKLFARSARSAIA